MTKQFPDFYAECAYNTGQQDARDGHTNGAASYVKFGEVEPIGMGWYRKGYDEAKAAA